MLLCTAGKIWQEPVYFRNPIPQILQYTFLNMWATAVNPLKYYIPETCNSYDGNKFSQYFRSVAAHKDNRRYQLHTVYLPQYTT
jgi:hypothetical protein